MILIIMSLGVFLFVLKYEKEITKAETQRYQSYLLADELRQSSDDLTRMARTYVVTGDDRYRSYFQKILDIRNGKVPRPDKYHSIYWDFVTVTGQSPQVNTKPVSLKVLMERAKFTTKEFALLRETESESNQLVELENRAMYAMVGFYPDSAGRYTVKGNPDRALARRLLHGEAYHKAKEKIMRPLAEFFNSIEQRTKEQVAILHEKKQRLNWVLSATMLLSITLLLVSVLLVVVSFKKGKEKESDVGIKGGFYFLRGHLWESASSIVASIAIIFMIVSLSWWFAKNSKSIAYKEARRGLELDLNSTYNAVLDWIDRLSLETTFFAEMIDRRFPSSLFQNLQSLQNLQELQELQTEGAGKDAKNKSFASFDRKVKKTGILNANFFTDYFLTNEKMRVVSSSRRDWVGKKLPLPEEGAKRINTPPYRWVHIPQGDSLLKGWTAQNVLFASRLSSENRGVLFFLVSPQKELEKIFRRSFSGDTGEVYMVNSRGQFITEGRWKDILLKRRWLKSEKDSLPGVEARQVWGDPNSPLTYAVDHVTKGRDSEELHHYRNYLGSNVTGLWQWNNTYQFGVVVEMSHKEAFDFLSAYQRQAFTGTCFTVFLILVLTLLFIWNRLKISKVNEELTHTYKTIKAQNEKLARDLLIGQKVQMDMLPHKIDGQGFALDAFLKPAQTVSGDFYDFSFVGKDKIYFCVGDVSGKGVGAALFMSMTKVSLNKTLSETLIVQELVDSVNKELSKNNGSCMFVTLVVGIMDIRSGKVHLTNAGHNPPYLKKANGDLVLIEKVNGPLLGAFEEASFEQQSLTLSQGDTLLFYTDGVTEAQNLKEEFYEEIRLENLLRNKKFSSPQYMVNTIYKDVMTFIGKANQFDDITLLSLQYAGFPYSSRSSNPVSE